MPWLIQWFRRERSAAPPEEQVLYDRAITAAQDYARTPVDSADAERAWDRVLVPIDELLTRRQATHLDSVRRTQAEHGDAGTQDRRNR